jgi:Outer membrane protein beta-barrel domain
VLHRETFFYFFMKIMKLFLISILLTFVNYHTRASELSVYGMFQYSITHGNEAVTYENGRGLGGGIEYRFMDFSFGADYSFQEFVAVGNDKRNRDFLEIYPLSFFAKYYIEDFAEQKPFFGIGYQQIDYRYINGVYNNQTRNFTAYPEDYKYTGYFLMLGADMDIWENIYLQTYARFNYIPRPNEALTYTDITLTLSYRFKI